MYISPTERMKKIHLWMGNTAADEQAYFSYFQQDDETSQFGEDIGLDGEYDEDMIGILPLSEEPIPVQEVLQKKVPIDLESIPQAEIVLEKLGISTANAAFYLTDSSVTVQEPYQKDYNGLSYIGIFKSAL